MAPTGSSGRYRSIYSVHPAVAYQQAVVKNLRATTGRSIKDWVRLVQESGLKDVKQVRAWLKERHELGGTSASCVADQALGLAGDLSDARAYLQAAAGYIETMYTGRRAALRPVHDALVRYARSLGEDVKICPCKTIVPFYRNHVFAEVKPSLGRIDLGLALKTTEKRPGRKLIDTGGLDKGDRITHRIPLKSIAEIDSEVEDWLRTAYELDGARH
jgi:hypothetical protein